MKNVILRLNTANDLERQVERILKDLGNPPPPLKLEEVRDLLKLDLGYYSKEQDGLLQEVGHKIIMASKQIFQRPTLLLEAIRKADLKALYLYDRRKIMLDDSLPKLKWRWNEAHEIGHSIIPWHSGSLLGDNKTTLAQTCRDQMEAEANYAAGQLLFMQNQATNEGFQMPLSIDTAKSLSRRYGNTITTTLWRLVEKNDGIVLGAVSHGHPRHTDHRLLSEDSKKYFIRSPRFLKMFSEIDEDDVFDAVQSYCSWQKGGTIGKSEVTLIDDNGELHTFNFETFYNTHDALTLGVYVRKKEKLFLSAV